MTTAETTIALLNRLSEPEMLDVQKYIKRIFASRKKSSENTRLKPITQAEFIKMIDKSDKDIAYGRVHSWAQTREETHRRYGI